MNIYDTREWVMANLDDGVVCPCCDQYAKTYRRKLNEAMARLLIWLVRSYMADPRFYNIHEFPLIQGRRGGGDFAKLIHWGVVIQKPNEGTEKRTSGMWKPTGVGIDFVNRPWSRIPSHVYLYNGEEMGFSDSTTNIREALGKRFSYAELMGHIAPSAID
ncbi:MAG: hypothetical protein QGG40_13360 [Myxococcota bacterium]|nr:hypothetical protein [Myxococcota bacterium]